MKTQLLAWLFFILCTKALSNYACEGTFTPQTRGHELMMLEKQLKNHENDRNIREGNEQSHGGLHETLHAKRGGYGGSDIVRRPTKSRSASSSLPVNPFSAFSTTLWHVSIGLLVFIFFF